jgi:hypothetical protein
MVWGEWAPRGFLFWLLRFGVICVAHARNMALLPTRVNRGLPNGRVRLLGLVGLSCRRLRHRLLALGEVLVAGWGRWVA